MLRDGRGLGPGPAVLAGALALGVSWLGLRWWSETGHALPPVALLTLVPLLGVLVAELVAAWQVRTMRRGPVEPARALRAARVLVLAQACALTGAIVAGWYLGHAATLAPASTITGRRTQLVLALVLAAAGVALSVAGYVAQAWCRRPGGDPDQRDERQERDDRGNAGRSAADGV